jgi:hypothetical protein
VDALKNKLNFSYSILGQGKINKINELYFILFVFIWVWGPVGGGGGGVVFRYYVDT